MKRGLRGRMARMERAMGVDPVRDALNDEDAAAEHLAAVALAEEMFQYETQAYALMRAMGCLDGPPDGPLAMLAEVARLIGETGAPWRQRVQRLLAELGGLPHSKTNHYRFVRDAVHAIADVHGLMID